MEFTTPVDELVRRRRSCRKYVERPLGADVREALAAFLAACGSGPFGGRPRFGLVAATAGDRSALRGLGTYGFIDGATAFIVGAVGAAPRDHEDYGYVMEGAILKATDLGLGTCWLGGSFSKSGFARAFALAGNELMPAVAAVGYPVEDGFPRDRIRKMAGSDFRRPAGELFFDGAFGAPLSPAAAGAYAGPLELVRAAPSASNRQPWRVVRTATGWHFFLARTKGYGKDTLLFRMLRMADLQRVDLGIAMCHFALGARASGLAGEWVAADPGIATPDAAVTYTATWRPAAPPG
jgi:nitroreductase